MSDNQRRWKVHGHGFDGQCVKIVTRRFGCRIGSKI